MKAANEGLQAAARASLAGYYGAKNRAMKTTGMRVLTRTPKRALAIGAHPDDVELTAGGTLARWIAAGCEATIVVCTDGAAGSTADDASRAAVAELRRREQETAARVLGAARVEMLGFPDGGLEETPEFRGAIVEMIRRYRPDTVLTHDGRTRGRLIHRDHRITGKTVEDAVYPFARDRLHYPDHFKAGLEPHKVAEVLLWDSDSADTAVPVDGFIERKAQALREHGSQLAGLFGEGADITERLTERAREAARRCGCAFTETFLRLLAPE